MRDAERFETATDDLSAVLAAMNRVDLNALLLDDDVRELLDCKQRIEEMRVRYREDLRGAEQDRRRRGGDRDA